MSRILYLTLGLVECAVALYLVLGQRAKLWSARWIQDDAYISFRYAKNFIEGHGFVFNPGEPVEGYTNFLWTLISTIPIALGHDDPIHFMHSLGYYLWILSYVVLAAVGFLCFLEGNLAAPLAIIPLGYHWSYNMWFVSGMETPLVSFFVILIIFFFTIDGRKHGWALVLMSLSAVGLIMTRPDGVMITAGVALAYFLIYWRSIFMERRWFRFVLLPALPFLLIYLPYTLWRIYFYGSFYPNTYYAKVAYLTFYSRGWEYLQTYFSVYAFLPFAPVAIAGAILTAPGANRRFLLGATLAALLSFFYVVRLGGDFMEWRFVTPVTGVLYPAIAVGAGAVLLGFAAFFQWFMGRKREGWRGSLWINLPTQLIGAALTIAIVFQFAGVTRKAESNARDTLVPGQETIYLLKRYCDPQQYNWKLVAKTLAEVIPENVRIATTSAGIIPYYCDRPCLDLHGLNDPIIGRERVDPKNRGRMGHEHWLQDFNVMRERGVDIYLFWADPKPFAKSLAAPPKENFEMVSVLLPDKRYVEFLILDHSAVDKNLMVQDKRLVFYDPNREREKQGVVKHLDLLKDRKVVDMLDLQDFTSEREHGFTETFLPTAPYGHNFHSKVLPYLRLDSETVLEDEGRRVFSGAKWSFNGIQPDKDAHLIIRYDHTGAGTYKVLVNAAEVSGRLNFRRGAEAWDEESIVIPASFLREGANEFEIVKESPPDSDAELYFCWLIQ